MCFWTATGNLFEFLLDAISSLHQEEEQGQCGRVTRRQERKTSGIFRSWDSEDDLS